MIGKELRKLNRLEILDLMLKERAEKDALQIQLNRIKREHPELDGPVPEQAEAPETPVPQIIEKPADLSGLREIRDTYAELLDALDRQMAVLKDLRAGGPAREETAEPAPDYTEDDGFGLDLSDIQLFSGDQKNNFEK